jgi:hypothetical protein
VAGILVIYILAAWGLSVIVPFTSDQIFSVIIAGIIATINVIIAFLIIYISKDKEQSVFAKIFLSGMAVRILLMLGVIFSIFKFTQTDLFVFVGALFVLYFVFQIWEVFVLNSKFK